MCCIQNYTIFLNLLLNFTFDLLKINIIKILVVINTLFSHLWTCLVSRLASNPRKFYRTCKFPMILHFCLQKWHVGLNSFETRDTARTKDNTGKPMLDGSFEKATPFSYGAGHLRPNRAMDPGLVYDMSTEDYLDFLCALGYNQTMIHRFTDEPHMCRDSLSLLDVNYPSFSVPNFTGTASLNRRLKNVGSPGTYRAVVHHPLGVAVSVEPSRLTFDKVGDEREFRVTLRAHRRIPVLVAAANATKEYAFGGLTWTDGNHFVRSPIVVGLGK